jgi:hypothetical protein
MVVVNWTVCGLHACIYQLDVGLAADVVVRCCDGMHV